MDDDPLVCDSVRRMLEFDQQKVRVAASALEAIAICERETFDLVILDYMMPIMKGDRLAVLLKERFPQLPIIMITAYGDVETKRKALENGADALLTKPIDFVLLRNEIDTRIERAA